MKIETYLFFDGRCEEALDFYKKTLGAEVGMLMRYKESPDPHSPESMPPGFEDKILYASVQIGETRLMASDGPSQGGPPNFKGFSLSIPAKSGAEAERLFAALSEGGQVHQPLTKTFFSPNFGMLADRFGVGWMILEQAEGNP